MMEKAFKIDVGHNIFGDFKLKKQPVQYFKHIACQETNHLSLSF